MRLRQPANGLQLFDGLIQLAILFQRKPQIETRLCKIRLAGHNFAKQEDCAVQIAQLPTRRAQGIAGFVELRLQAK